MSSQVNLTFCVASLLPQEALQSVGNTTPFGFDKSEILHITIDIYH